jgi:hypothetical protein
LTDVTEGLIASIIRVMKPIALMMEALSTSEKLISFYETI